MPVFLVMMMPGRRTAETGVHILLWRNLKALCRKSVIALFGKYIIHGAKNTQFPRFLDDEATTEYPSFIIGLASDGKPIPASCDPSQLSGYPGSSPNQPNKLEQVCFKPEVLQRYSANPDKYQVSDRSIACVINGRTLWQLDISTNSDGLVEAYLGDLAADCLIRNCRTGNPLISPHPALQIPTGYCEITSIYPRTPAMRPF